MRSKVVEITTACNVSLYTPGKIFTVIIQVTWRLGKTDLYIDYVTDSSVFYQFFYFLEVGKITAVVCNETGNSRFFGYAVNARTFFVCDGHRFLNIGRLTCFHRHDGVCSMG